MERIIGVLGGMGPSATVDAFSKIITNTPAMKDQEHIPVVVASLPAIPDRTDNILSGGPSPFPAMLNSLRILERSGASCIIMPCNTAHYWYDELKKNTQAEFISIIESTSEKVMSAGIKSVGLIATTATVEAKLYQHHLESYKISCIHPDPHHQDIIMRSIQAYKRGDHRISSQMMVPCVDALRNKGVEKIIMGCTEVPLILDSMIREHAHDFIDATDELIKKAIEWYFR